MNISLCPRKNCMSYNEDPVYVLKGHIMNTLSFFKTVTELVVATGVSSIVSNASKAAVPENARLIKKISIGVGTFILSNMVAEQAVKYTKDKIDQGLEELEKTRGVIADAKEQIEANKEAKENN